MANVLFHNGLGIPTYPTNKDPDATLDYFIAFDQWLGAGETIASRAWSATGVTIVSSSTGGSIEVQGKTYTDVESVRLSGGTPGSRAIVSCRITTSVGQIEDRSFYLNIANN